MPTDQTTAASHDHERLVRSMITLLASRCDGALIERIQTHGASLLLTPQRVYKIKKPVDLGFLDFSTLEKRRYVCEEELRINRRYAPDLYRRVVPITGSHDQPRLDGDGPIIDYAVEMHRFPAEQRLDLVLERGDLSTADIITLADQLSRLHADCPRASTQTARDLSSILKPLHDNLTDCERLLADQPALTEVVDWSRRMLHALQPVLARRLEQGFVRECHGDLHLANLYRDADGMHPFDAIEFDAALRWIDVMNDLAFLLMDLEQRGASDLAAVLLSQYLEKTGDYDGLEPLALFRCYRALVRAKIAALSGNAADVNRYLSLARRCTLSQPPTLWQMGGLSGSGKSTRALELVREHGAIRIRSDVERKRLFGLSADTHTGSAVGAGIYTAAAGEQTYQRLLTLAHRCLEFGYSVVIDAASLRRSERTLFRNLAETHGWRWRLIWCAADPATLRARIEQRLQAGSDASEATTQVLEAQLRVVEPPDDTETERRA